MIEALINLTGTDTPPLISISVPVERKIILLLYYSKFFYHDYFIGHHYLQVIDTGGCRYLYF